MTKRTRTQSHDARLRKEVALIIAAAEKNVRHDERETKRDISHAISHARQHRKLLIVLAVITVTCATVRHMVPPLPIIGDGSTFVDYAFTLITSVLCVNFAD